MNLFFLLAFFFLVGSLFFSTFQTAIIHLGKIQSLELLKSPSFFFRPLLQRFFYKNEWENLYLSTNFSKHTLRLLYAIFAFFYLLPFLSNTWPSFFYLAGTILVISLVSDFILLQITTLYPKTFLRTSSFICSFYLFLLLPLVALLLKITTVFSKWRHKTKESQNFSLLKSAFQEILSQSNKQLDPYDEKLLDSFLTFRQRLAKEIMIPRIDISALSTTATVEEALQLFLKEGYSRIPIFRDHVDNVVGVLLYKDLLKLYANNKKDVLSTSLETLLKPVIYVPESKKISSLLQEFRQKQIHLAIIVNEYGGTEGIVTIEDILEELVGEIEDEHDVDEDELYWEIPGGGWVVDAKMSVVDIASKLHIPIPHSPQYDTIGGYVFHRAGSIPTKGWQIHHDEFDLEVLSSNERSIEKVRINPREKRSSFE